MRLVLIVLLLFLFVIVSNRYLCNIGWKSSITFGLLFTIIWVSPILFVTLITHCTANSTIEKNKTKYESLIAERDSLTSNEDVSKIDTLKKNKEDTIEDIIEWNLYVHECKHRARDPWTSMLCSSKVVDNLKYIDIGDIK